MFDSYNIPNNPLFEEDPSLTLEQIESLCSIYYRVPPEKLKSKTRERQIVEARQVAIFLSKQFVDLSLRSIAQHYGGRDHTTAIHSIQTVKDLMDTDPVYRSKVYDLKTICESGFIPTIN